VVKTNKILLILRDSSMNGEFLVCFKLPLFCKMIYLKINKKIKTLQPEGGNFPLAGIYQIYAVY
jgi:hypothetical protein